MLTATIIVGLVMTVPIIAIITEHKQKVVKIQHQILQDEIELEKIKQKNFIIETEKMKIELEQKKLEYSSDLNQLLELKSEPQKHNDLNR